MYKYLRKYGFKVFTFIKWNILFLNIFFWTYVDKYEGIVFIDLFSLPTNNWILLNYTYFNQKLIFNFIIMRRQIKKQLCAKLEGWRSIGNEIAFIIMGTDGNNLCIA